MKTPLLFASLLLFTALTFAQVRFVSKTGSSTPPYTSWETASDSIQKCINICNDGDTVVVANGTYRESLVINSAITMLGSGIDSCIIDGRGLASLTIKPNRDFTIENFHIIGKAIESMTGVIEAFVDFVTCKNLWIENAYEGIGASSGATIQNCLFYNINYCISTSSANNIDTFKIANNIILNNKTGGKGIFNDGGGLHYIYNNMILSCIPPNVEGLNVSGIDLWISKVIDVKNNLIANYGDYNYSGTTNCDTTIIENNVFWNSDSRWGLNMNVAYLHSKKTSFRNNIVAYGKKYGIYATSGLVVDYNLFWKNGKDVLDGIILGEHNVFADPLFVKDTVLDKTLSFDFHLQGSSPAKDAGDPNLFDADGSRSDIGMYGGQLGEAFALLNRDIPPETPVMSAAYRYDSLRFFIYWLMSTEKDFDHYNIYKDTIANFYPTSQNKFCETDTSLLLDYYNQPARAYYYKITAVDKGNNESLDSDQRVVTITGIDDPKVEIVGEYKLHQNYPNPFNASTIIGYTLKETGYIKLTVYDIKGERITVLENGIKETGYHQVVFDAGKLASGIYIYRMEVTGNDHIPKYSDMKKTVLLK